MEKTVCICGAGTMGRGISITIAASGASGMKIILFDLNEQVISAATSLIEKELDQEVERKRITPDEKEKIIERISYTSSFEDCHAPLIIEAILEESGEKSALFTNLERINSPETIFATNTSSLSVTGIARTNEFPGKNYRTSFF